MNGIRMHVYGLINLMRTSVRMFFNKSVQHSTRTGNRWNHQPNWWRAPGTHAANQRYPALGIRTDQVAQVVQRAQQTLLYWYIGVPVIRSRTNGSSIRFVLLCFPPVEHTRTHTHTHKDSHRQRYSITILGGGIAAEGGAKWVLQTQPTPRLGRTQHGAAAEVAFTGLFAIFARNL